jgi:hypothetical protein
MRSRCGWIEYAVCEEISDLSIKSIEHVPKVLEAKLAQRHLEELIDKMLLSLAIASQQCGDGITARCHSTCNAHHVVVQLSIKLNLRVLFTSAA